LCGLPASVSAVSLAVLGLFNIAGSLGCGFVIQRYSMHRTLAVLYAGRAAGIVLFMVAPKTGLTVLAFSAWMGLTYMAVLPPTAGLIGKFYGTQRLATLLGITFMVHQAGAFLGGWLGGIVLERTGSYDAMWVLDFTLACLAAATSLTLRDADRSAIAGTASPVARAAA
jgi:predicted MFS family arabinose efflux permease